MPTLSRIPGELNLIFVIGDDLPISIDLDQSIVGSTWECSVYVDGVGVFATPPGETYETDPGAVVFSPTVTVTNAAAGQLSISITDAQTDLMSPNITYRWFLRQTVSGVSRTIVAGFAEARDP